MANSFSRLIADYVMGEDEARHVCRVVPIALMRSVVRPVTVKLRECRVRAGAMILLKVEYQHERLPRQYQVRENWEN